MPNGITGMLFLEAKEIILDTSFEVSGKLTASGRYSEFLKSTLDKKIKTKKLKIVLDCGNGATYEIAPNIFWELGHNVISINNKPNGININYNCGAVNIDSLSKKVIEEKQEMIQL